jgi:hypothetical protein
MGSKKKFAQNNNTFMLASTAPHQHPTYAYQGNNTTESQQSRRFLKGEKTVAQI